MINYFSENIFEKNLLEKWLDFYAFQLKRDLTNEAQLILNTLEIEQDHERIVKNDLSIIDINLYNKKHQRKTIGAAYAPKDLKSKLLLDSISSVFLLVNKISRITNVPVTISNNNKSDLFLEKINIKRINLDVAFKFLIKSISEMIDHFLVLNENLLFFHEDFSVNTTFIWIVTWSVCESNALVSTG